MIKVSTNGFKRLVENNLTATSIVPSISKKDIKEFKIGKSYFYTIKNKSKFQIKYNKKIYCIYDILNTHFSKSIPLNNATTSFRKDFSYLNFFEPHRNSYHFIRLDIRSFFHSIDIEEVKKVFSPYFNDNHIDENKTQLLIDAFINLVTYEIPKNSANEHFKGKRVLPMGFKTSPMISNVIFRQLDIQIQKLCSENNIEYTRYADDMLFSSSKDLNFIHSGSFINEIRVIIAQLNFKLNAHKTIMSKHTLSLNGYTIEYKKSELRLSNKKINIIKKMIHMILVQKESEDVILKKLFQYKMKWKFRPLDRETYEKYHLEQLLNKVLGYRSYLLSVVKFNKKYHCTLEETINKYSDIIYKLNFISNDFQLKIEELEKTMELNKPFHRMDKIKIDSLILTDEIKGKLKNNNYKTLRDLYEITEEKLINDIYGIGKVKAKKIIEVRDSELNKIQQNMKHI